MKVKEVKPKLKMWIGQVNLIGKWLDSKGIAYNEEDVKLIPDDDDAEFIGWEFTLDKEWLQEEEAQEEMAPGIFEKGSVKITFQLK